MQTARLLKMLIRSMQFAIKRYMYVDKVRVFLLLNNLFETFTKLFIIFSSNLFSITSSFSSFLLCNSFSSDYYRNPFFSLVKHFHSSVNIKS